MNISYSISEDRKTLTLYADESAREELREMENYGWAEEAEALEHLLCNSELQWVYPGDTGDLTDAPMIGIFGEPQEEESGPYGCRPCGRWDDSDQFEPILERWAFMPYQVRSFLADLEATGRAVFTA